MNPTLAGIHGMHNFICVRADPLHAPRPSGPQYLSLGLFIVGSMMFAAAAFTNALNQRKYNDDASRLLTAVTSLYFAGSTLFIMGSIAFLPDLGCNEKMVSIGAWLFIVGSVFFTLGSVLSLCRTIQILGFGDFGERTPVRESAEKALT
eukprot:TRINITY_DN23571_c0_g4_i1.p1 TRINITY_DN23571_c0_g4~~TRINITY_DN23571_c0_g4_i1.p1  ORF type:complete len:149 (-),score=28.82 TRINITY_DN23571_c0_g4_i1:161-607(-)